MFGLFKGSKSKTPGQPQANSADAKQSGQPRLSVEGTPDPAILDKARQALATGTAQAHIRRTASKAGDRDAAAAIRRLLEEDR